MKAVKFLFSFSFLGIFIVACSLFNEMLEPKDIFSIIGSPAVEISIPSDNDSVFTNFTITGTVKPGDNISEVSVYISDSNTTEVFKTSLDAFGNISCELSVKHTGVFTVWVEAVSGNGKTGTSEKIQITAVDFILNITSPTNDGAVWWVGTGTVTIGGIVQSSTRDAYTISMILSTSTNMKLSDYPGESPWSISINGLTPGTNNVILSCRKVRTGELSPQKKLTLIRDTIAPTALITIPSTDYTTYKANVIAAFGGQAEGTLSPVSAVYISTNGTSFVPVSNLVCTQYSAEWQHSYTFGYGIHNIWIYSIDKVGNVSATNQRIIECKDLIFVSPTGNDINNGLSKDNAVLTIQKAINLAVSNGFDTVWVEQGKYMPGFGLMSTSAFNNYAGINITDSGLKLIGGWDANFVNRNGYSLLDGYNIGDNNKHVIFLNNVSNILIDGFIISGGSANINDSINKDGGGIYIFCSTDNIFTNCVISNNYAINNGGGIILSSSYRNIIHGSVINNNSDSDGGGIYIMASDYNTIYSIVCGNSTTLDGNGGGIFIGGSYNLIKGYVMNNVCYKLYGEGGGLYINGNYNIIEGTISGNLSYGSGGGMYIIGNGNQILGDIRGNISFNSEGGGIFLSGDNNTINSLVELNYSFDSGGGIRICSGWGNILNCLIMNNGTYGNGGGLNISTAYTTINGLIQGNYSDHGNGGGVWVYGGQNLFNCSVFNNNAALAGGGYYFQSSSYNTINGIISNNFSLTGGGGLAVVAFSSDNVFNCSVLNNSAKSGGGGFSLNSSSRNTLKGSIMYNKSTIGGGVAIVDSIDTTMSNINISGNIATNFAAAIYVANSGIKVLSCIITNNSGSNVIYLVNNGITGFMLSNCLIGGSGNELAIQEGISDAAGHYLVGNTFITNTLSSIYKEYTGNAYILCNNGWTNINVPAFMDAATASGNKVTNIP
ncbi:MAG: hypothetical protein HPY53_02905 [Brevinematales bacterium]|nr:hypothetical protein [Brevinematales bacterium]